MALNVDLVQQVIQYIEDYPVIYDDHHSVFITEAEKVQHGT